MNRAIGIVGVIVIAFAAMGLALLNTGVRVTLDLGLFQLYQVPLTFVVFGGFVGGMLVMLFAGLHTDLRVREILRERLRQEAREEREAFIDLNQRDLFQDESEE